MGESLATIARQSCRRWSHAISPQWKFALKSVRSSVWKAAERRHKTHADCNGHVICGERVRNHQRLLYVAPAGASEINSEKLIAMRSPRLTPWALVCRHSVAEKSRTGGLAVPRTKSPRSVPFATEKSIWHRPPLQAGERVIALNQQQRHIAPAILIGELSEVTHRPGTVGIERQIFFQQ